jgi:hypothetical protein
MSMSLMMVLPSLFRRQVMTENVRTNWFCSLALTLLILLKCYGSTGWWVSIHCACPAEWEREREWVSVCVCVHAHANVAGLCCFHGFST